LRWNKPSIYNTIKQNLPLCKISKS
jgi:hypothetical protein